MRHILILHFDTTYFATTLSLGMSHGGTEVAGGYLDMRNIGKTQNLFLILLFICHYLTGILMITGDQALHTARDEEIN